MSEDTQSLAVHTAGVRRQFNGRTVLADVDIDIRADEFVALLGRSGSGKSTFLRVLAGLDREAEGRIVVAKRRAVVFQDARLIPWKRVVDNVALGLEGADIGSRVDRVLGEVGWRDTAKPGPRHFPAEKRSV